MKRVLTAVVLVPLVLLVVFKAPLWVFAPVIVLITLLCLREYLGIIKGYGMEPVRWPVYVVSLLLIAGAFLHLVPPRFTFLRFVPLTWILVPVISALLPLIFGIPLVFRKNLGLGLAAASSSGLGVLYIAAPLCLLMLLRWRETDSQILLVFVLFSVWAGDIAAYYVGKNLGRHKLAPAVSPNKTWEGAIASLLASVGFAFLVFHFAPRIALWFSESSAFWLLPGPEHASNMRYYIPGGVSPWFVCSLGIVSNVAAQFGDLFESAIKRGAQVKDSGSLLPGHGGILDRIDALLFAIPAVWYYAELTRLF